MTYITINGKQLSPEKVADLFIKLSDDQIGKVTRKLTLQQKVQVLRYELRRECLEREGVIDALIALFLCDQHGILVGPPGTGKTFLVDLICSAMGGKLFAEQLSEYHQPEHLFGALLPKELMDNGNFIRKTENKLPEATDAYLDEIWKAPTPLMNTLLAALNERVFYNPGKQTIPLRTAIGSSNELPNDARANALVDRFTYKMWIGYLQKDDSTLELWKRKDEGYVSKINISLSLGDRDSIKSEISKVKISHQFRLLNEIKKTIESIGYKVPHWVLLGEERQVSDRKWMQIHTFLKAIAWVIGKDVVDVEVIKTHLVDCLWFVPDDRDKMQAKIEEVIQKFAKSIKDIRAKAEKQMTNFHGLNDEEKLTNWQTTIGELSALGYEIIEAEQWGEPMSECQIVHSIINDSIALVEQTINSVKLDRSNEEARSQISDKISECKLTLNLWCGKDYTSLKKDQIESLADFEGRQILSQLKELEEQIQKAELNGYSEEANRELKAMKTRFKHHSNVLRQYKEEIK